MADQLPCRGRIDLVRMDLAAVARSSLGAVAYGEYERVFGTRLLARWPVRQVLDGLDTVELLLDTDNLTIHPRCVRLKDAFLNYCKQRRGSEWIDFPADGHPEEDFLDALRGGIRDALPNGASDRAQPPADPRCEDLLNPIVSTRPSNERSSPGRRDDTETCFAGESDAAGMASRRHLTPRCDAITRIPERL